MVYVRVYAIRLCRLCCFAVHCAQVQLCRPKVFDRQSHFVVITSLTWGKGGLRILDSSSGSAVQQHGTAAALSWCPMEMARVSSMSHRFCVGRWQVPTYTSKSTFLR